ncbi:ATP-binding protein [Alicyclobacillus suci]|uniref:ATP-binding protein n=1 Tax=Alicyclobacillus suci TaxID=2816080 RepID=UPI001A8E9095|nr:ATP-binding protein [Alicyclobacillus suci]
MQLKAAHWVRAEQTIWRFGLCIMGVFLALIIASAVLFQINTQSALDSMRNYLHIDQQLDELKISLIDAETSQREYVLTGDASDLASFEADAKRYADIADALHQCKFPDDMNRKMETTISQGNQWLSQFGRPQILRKQLGRPVMQKELATGATQIERFQQSVDHLQSQVMQVHNQVDSALGRKVRGIFVPFFVVVGLLGGVVVLTLVTYLARRQQSEMALRNTERRLRHAQRLAQVASWEWDLLHDMRTWSPEMMELFAVDAAAFDGHQFDMMSYIHEEDRELVGQAIHQAVERGTLDVEYRIIRADGVERFVHSVAEVVYNRSGDATRLVGVIQDVTDRRQTEELIRRTEKLSIVGELAAGVAHEIRNPLTAISGFIEILQTVPPDVQEHYLAIVREELNHINVIVSEFLLLAKPQVATYKVNSLEPLVQDVVQLLQTQAILKNVVLVYQFDEDVLPIRCEANQMKQVLVNLVKNAVEAVPEGGHVEVRVEGCGQEVAIRVVDNGVGIPKERMKRLGEPFYSTKERGTGLGLMVSQRIVESHGGRMIVESTVGRGTTVSVVLPVSTDALQPV